MLTPDALTTNAAPGGAHTVLLFVSPSRRDRYPLGTVVAADGAYLRYQEAVAGQSQNAGDVSAVVVDDAENATWQKFSDDVPLILSSTEVMRLVRSSGGLATLQTKRWLPFTPAACSPELEMASGWVRQGRIGTPRILEVTATVTSQKSRWESDHPGAADIFEALVFAMQVTELLLGSEVAACRSLGGEAMPRIVEHQTSSGVLVLTRLLNSAATTAPSYAAELCGSSGRVLLRPEFAPGPLGLHTSEGLEFPAVRAPKSSIQSPDTVQGGWDGVEVVRIAMLDSPRAGALRQQIERLTALASSVTN